MGPFGGNGSQFDFHGQPGRFYNIISDGDIFQVVARTRSRADGQGAGPDMGTYINGVSLAYEGEGVLVELSEDDTLRVSLNERLLPAGEVEGLLTKRTATTNSGRGKLRVWWLKEHELFHDLVMITIEPLALVVELVPAKGDTTEVRPSYLTANVTLLGAAGKPLQGVIGETHRESKPPTPGRSTFPSITPSAVPLSFPLRTPEHYEMLDFFPTRHSKAAGGVINAKRKLALNQILTRQISLLSAKQTRASDPQLVDTA